MALSGKVAAFYKQTGSPKTLTQEALERIDSREYRIADRSKAYWNKGYPVTVERSTDGGETWVIVTAGFEVQHVGGYVVFAQDQDEGTQFRVSGQYYELAQVGGAFSWTVETSLDTVDTPTFESEGWNEVTPTIKSFTGSAEAYWINGGHIDELGEELIIVFFVNAKDPKKPRYEGYGLLTSVSTEAPVDDVIQEPLEFTGTSRLFYREG